MARRIRLGWLGPAIVVVGAAVAAIGTCYMVRSRPEAGAVIDRVAAGPHETFVIRRESGSGDRAFVELHRDDQVVWQALVPPYAGRPGAPGLAWNRTAVTVRVIRDGRAEIFALALGNAAKLGGFKLAPGHSAVAIQATGPVTLTDHVRSYEIVSGVGWAQLVAIELDTGEALWKQELGDEPIEDGGVANGVVWIRQGAIRKAFRVADGSIATLPSSL